MAIAELLAGVLGGELPIEVRAYDGSRVGPVDAPAAIVLRTPNALRRMITAPGELGLGRAYVAGDLDVEGDLFAVLSLHKRLDGLQLKPGAVRLAAEDRRRSRRCARSRHRPKKRVCAVGGTRKRATPPRSRTTTTCRTTSTRSCSGRR